MSVSVFTRRDYGSTFIVAVLTSAFGVALLQVSDVLGKTISADKDVAAHQQVQTALHIVVVAFIGIAVYVGSIVTVNTVSTVIAGRTRPIALLRLLGANAKFLRRRVAVEGFLVGVIGSILGAVVGVGLTAVAFVIAIATSSVPAVDYELFDPIFLVPMVAVVGSTWLSSWVGSRRVGVVSPVEALGAVHELPYGQAASRLRRVAATIFGVVGVVLLAAGVMQGLINMSGFLIAFAGGIVSFIGIVVGAAVIIPPVLRLAGRLLPRDAASRLAALNAVRHPERSARSTIGLVIGVSLVTTFAVAMTTFQSMVIVTHGDDKNVADLLPKVILVFSALIAFSGVIAAIGTANSLSLSVMQRTRELGLLRALGLTSVQVRLMIVAESLLLTLAAVVFGVLLGIGYGWAGAQSLLGSERHLGFVVPTIPWLLIAGIIVAAIVFALAASLAPVRRATTVAPIVALAVD